MIKTKRVYDKKSIEDGRRILVMRFWPRGVKKNDIDVWLKNLGTDPDLIRQWKSGAIQWDEFRQFYIEGLQAPEKQELIDKLLEMARETPTITLLCGCLDERYCHRRILKEIIEQRNSYQ